MKAIRNFFCTTEPLLLAIWVVFGGGMTYQAISTGVVEYVILIAVVMLLLFLLIGVVYVVYKLTSWLQGKCK